MKMTAPAAENVFLNVEVQKIWLDKHPLNEIHWSTLESVWQLKSN